MSQDDNLKLDTETTTNVEIEHQSDSELNVELGTPQDREVEGISEDEEFGENREYGEVTEQIDVETQDESYVQVNEEPIEEPTENTPETVLESTPESTGRKKRGLPKTFQANQEKYMAAIEKKQKMMNISKNKKNPL